MLNVKAFEQPPIWTLPFHIFDLFYQVPFFFAMGFARRWFELSRSDPGHGMAEALAGLQQ